MIEITDGTAVITAPELAQEFGKRVVTGLLKACRAYVPTRENLEGKKEHCDVSLKGGAIYLGTDHSVYAAIIRPNTVDMCKKKSPLRDAMEQVGPSMNAKLNYGVATPWLKTHEKNIRSAVFGPDGIRLVVADGMVELDLSPTAASAEYAEAVAQTLAERVVEENLELGPLPLGTSAKGFDVLYVTKEEAGYRATVDLDSADFQMKFRPELLPEADHEVRVYADPEGGKIVRVTTDSDAVHVEQYFRVLDLAV
jgi:hypothetical protein